jgi:4-hydroxybenzoyl-CoA thioesterase/acyl-CoA thioester hydrolase
MHGMPYVLACTACHTLWHASHALHLSRIGDQRMGFRTRRMVEFRDTDAAGIAHFSVFFPWMEAAEHEMLRSIGIAVLPPDAHGPEGVTWPRVSVKCDYHSAVRFEDWLEIDVAVERLGRSSVSYAIEFSRQTDSGEVDRIASGTVVTVCCRLRPGGGLEKVEIPLPIRERLRALQE